MAAGFLDPPPKEKVRPPRKQVRRGWRAWAWAAAAGPRAAVHAPWRAAARLAPCCWAAAHSKAWQRSSRADAALAAAAAAVALQVLVVVTAAWRVLAYDHNLKLLWEQPLDETLPPHASVREVGLLPCRLVQDPRPSPANPLSCAPPQWSWVTTCHRVLGSCCTHRRPHRPLPVRPSRPLTFPLTVRPSGPCRWRSASAPTKSRPRTGAWWWWGAACAWGTSR